MINVGTGNLLLQADDMNVPHKGIAFTFRRTYNSQSGHDVNGTDGTPPGMYGNGWTNTFDAHVARQQSNPYIVSVYDVDGARYDYRDNGDGTFSALHVQHATLTDDKQCGYLWTKKSGTIYHFYRPDVTAPGCGSTDVAYNGRLQQIIGRNQNTTLTLTYAWVSGAGQGGKIDSIAVTTESGLAATLKFGDVKGHQLLQTLTWPDNKTKVMYTYGASYGNLRSVILPPNSAAGTPVIQGYGYGSWPGGNAAGTMNWVASPRWTGSNGTDGSYLQIGYRFTGADNAHAMLSEIDHVGFMDPAPPDGTNTLLQPLPSNNSANAGAPFLAEYYGLSAVGGVSTPTFRDSDGHYTNWSVDAAGRPLQTQECVTTQAQQCTGTMLLTGEQWDGDDNLTATVDARGFETDYAYDANGNTVAVAAPAVTMQAQSGPVFGRPTKLFSYEVVNGVNYNNVSAYCDEVWSQSHQRDWDVTGNPGSSDSLCPVIAGSPGAPAVPTFVYQHPSYEKFGQLTSSSSAMGYKKTYVYPQQGTDYGLPTDVIGASFLQIDGKTAYQAHQTFGYDQHGDLTSYGTGAGTWSLAYDAMNRLTVLTDPDGYSSYRTYFPDGSLNRTETPAQHAANIVHTYAFDAAVAYGYDLDGNATSETHHHSNLVGVTQKWYDGADRLVEVQSPLDTRSFSDGFTFDYVQKAPMVRYLYDLSAGGQTAFGTTAFSSYGNHFVDQHFINGAWTSVRGTAYDALDRSTADYRWSSCGQSCTPVVEMATSQYDAPADPVTGAPRYGLLVSRTSAVNQTTAYRYDARAKTAEIDFSGTAPTAPNRTYQYDPAGRTTSIFAVGVGTQAYAYDIEGKLASSGEPSGGSISSPAVLQYTYYPNGSRATLSVASSALVQQNLFTYTYRNDGEKVAQMLNAAGYSKSFAWTYTPAGRLYQRSDSYSNPSEVRTYDGAGGLLTQQLASSGTYTVGQYDDEGDVQALTFSGPGVPPSSRTMTYNIRGELVADTGASAASTREQQALNGLMITRMDYGNQAKYEVGTPDFDQRNGLFLSWNAPNPNSETITTQTSKVWGFDAAGREGGTAATRSLPPGTNLCSKWILQFETQQFSGYDFENHLVSQSSDFGLWNPSPKPCGTQPQLIDPSTTTYVYGPDGHALTKTDQPANSVFTNYATLHWDGDQLLFTTAQSGTSSGMNGGYDVDVKMGIDADVTFGIDANNPGQPVIYSGITVNDRDPSGGEVNQYNTTGHGTWVPADPYATTFQGTGYKNPGFTAPIYMMTQPRPDGVSDGTNIMQGVRVYDPSLRQWATPDAYAGNITDPSTRREYMWNRNNPYAYSDPSGYESTCYAKIGCIKASMSDDQRFKVLNDITDFVGLLALSLDGFGGGQSLSGSQASGRAIGGVIKGYTRHGLNRGIDRPGGAASERAILDAVKNPLSMETKTDAQGRVSTTYLGKDAQVTLNMEGKIVTSEALSSAGKKRSGANATEPH